MQAGSTYASSGWEEDDDDDGVRGEYPDGFQAADVVAASHYADWAGRVCRTDDGRGVSVQSFFSTCPEVDEDVCHG